MAKVKFLVHYHAEGDEGKVEQLCSKVGDNSVQASHKIEGNISTPVRVTGVGKDGNNNHTQDSLGVPPESALTLFATTLPAQVYLSGSSRTIRRFRIPAK